MTTHSYKCYDKNKNGEMCQRVTGVCMCAHTHGNHSFLVSHLSNEEFG